MGLSMSILRGTDKVMSILKEAIGWLDRMSTIRWAS